MITSAKNYIKKKRTYRTIWQMVKTKLYRTNHAKKHTHTHSQKEKMKKLYIYKKREESNQINKSTNHNKL